MSRVKNLNRRYDDFLIDIPELELPEVGIVALMGHSGSGKSSVIRLLLGLDECPSLSWELGGVDIAKLPTEERNLSVVFQSYELFPHMTARENIEFAMRARLKRNLKLSAEQASERVNTLIAKLELASCIDRQARVLSGGEKQRVALARALVGQPQFLMLDEPFSALDADLRDKARLLVKSLIDEIKIPTLIVTHDEQDVRAMSAKVIRITNGRIVG